MILYDTDTVCTCIGCHLVPQQKTFEKGSPESPEFGHRMATMEGWRNGNQGSPLR